MGIYYFPSFLSDQREYEQAEQLWRERWGDLVRRLGQVWFWESPWLSTTFADGTPCRDGNPIFSAVSHYRRLGVHIIQLEPSDTPKEFYVWTDTFAKGSPEAIKELVISCVLTDHTLLKAIDLMERWIIEEKVELSWKDEYSGMVPVPPSISPRRLELAVA